MIHCYYTEIIPSTFPGPGASTRKFLLGVAGGGGGSGGFVKSWTSYPGKYLDLIEGATKTK